MIALPWKKLCANFILPCGENHYGFFLRCPTSFYNRPSNLVKLIPGVGTIAGGAISAATAGVLTAALGEAYIGIMTLVFNGEMSIDDLGTKRGKDQMTAL